LPKRNQILLTNFKVVPTHVPQKHRAANKKAAETEPVPTDTNMTQGDDSSNENQSPDNTQAPALAEVAEEVSERPERQARKGVQRLLRRITEEPESDGADTPIGNYELRDEGCGSQGAGQVGLIESDSDNDYLAADGYDSSWTTGKGIATASTRVRKQPLGRPGSTNNVPKPRAQANQTKAMGGSKRKYRDLELASTNGDTNFDLESEVELEGESKISLDAYALILPVDSFHVSGRYLKQIRQYPQGDNAIVHNQMGGFRSDDYRYIEFLPSKPLCTIRA
jgi:hypothetical protein